MDIDEFQILAHQTANTEDDDVYLLGLIGEAGSVASSIKKVKRDNTARLAIGDEIKAELGDVLWYVAELATRNGLQLSDIAKCNLVKTKYLFHGSEENFDENSPSDQCLPTLFIAKFSEGPQKIKISIDGVDFGDPLDDNSWDDDGYRYHDVFHLAYAIKLGWSPVIRKLLKRKRSYDAEIDRIEDGARSVFLDEGISVAIFNQNVIRGGVSSLSVRGNIPFSLLEMVKTMTKGCEVRVRDVDGWRDAISAGFQMFDQLIANRGGRIVCDRSSKSMIFEALLDETTGI